MVASEDFTIGAMICQQMRICPAPSILADSTMASGIVAMLWRSMNMQKESNMPIVMRLSRVLTSPSWLMMM